MKKRLLGHRGVPGEAPENTLVSFKRALDLGIGGVELDVQLSRDGHLVVCHDETLDRTTSGRGYIKDITLTEMKKLDAGSWFHKRYACEQVPVLEEVLDLFKGQDFLLNIEIKSGIILYPGIEEKLIKVMEDYKVMDKCIVSSFNHYSLVKIKELCPAVKIGLLYYAGLVDPWEYALRLKAYSLHPFYPSVTEAMIKKSAAQGIKVIPFPVNKEKLIKTFLEWGVEYVITDIPHKLV
ncbi:MAG: glycerophosphodiester phosphodiesterase [Bacillota bacterium]